MSKKPSAKPQSQGSLQPDGYVAFVGWEYEDNLPKNINKPHFDAMFELSRVDGVRLYPFIEWEGIRIYLAAT